MVQERKKRKENAHMYNLHVYVVAQFYPGFKFLISFVLGYGNI